MSKRAGGGNDSPSSSARPDEKGEGGEVGNNSTDGGKADDNSPLNETKETFVSDDEEACPCGGETGGLLVECGTCTQWYHVECVGLKGLTDKMIEVLENWECPRCFTPVFDCRKSRSDRSDDIVHVNSDTVSSSTCNTIRLMIKEELHGVCNVLKATVTSAAEAAVKTVTPNVVTGVVEKTKSYAAAAEANQKKLVEEVKAATTSKELVSQICKKMDVDSSQREKRKCNIMVSNVPEPEANLTSKQKKEADIVYMCKHFEMEKNEIIDCFRTGAAKKDGSGNPLPRPIIARMIDQESAEYWHNFGKGYRVNDNWINPDLCKVDRDAQFFVRQERRRRKQETQTKQAKS